MHTRARRTRALALLGKMRLRAPRALPRNNLRREIHDNRDYPREFRMQVSPRSHGGVCPPGSPSRIPVLFRAIRSISAGLCSRTLFSSYRCPHNFRYFYFVTLLRYFLPGPRFRAQTAVREGKIGEARLFGEGKRMTEKSASNSMLNFEKCARYRGER